MLAKEKRKAGDQDAVDIMQRCLLCCHICEKTHKEKICDPTPDYLPQANPVYTCDATEKEHVRRRLE
jgi:hypothetical protein